MLWQDVKTFSLSIIIIVFSYLLTKNKNQTFQGKCDLFDFWLGRVLH